MKDQYAQPGRILLCSVLTLSFFLSNAQQWSVYTQTDTGIPIEFNYLAFVPQREYLATDKENYIWMRFEDGKIGRYSSISNQWLVSDESADNVFTDTEGNIYLSANDKTFRHDGTNWIEIFDEGGEDYVLDSEGKFWYCALGYDTAIHQYDGGVITKFGDPSVGVTFGVQVEQDADGFIWSAFTDLTPNAYLIQLNGAVSYDNTHSDIFNYFLSSLEVLKNNNIWVGTTPFTIAPSKGTAFLNRQTDTWTMYNRSNSPIPGDTITYLQGDDHNRIWIGTNKGLARFDGTDWNVYTKENSSLPSDTVLSIAIDTMGTKWIATPNALVAFNEIIPAFDYQNCERYVVFTDQSQSIDGTIEAWQWDFAGLGSSTEKNPKFTFPVEGTYAVTLTVKDVMGTYNYITLDVTINDPVNPLNLGTDVDTCTPSVTLSSNLSEAHDFSWTFPSGEITTGGSSVIATQNGTYVLEVTTEESCAYSDTINVILNRFTTTVFSVSVGEADITSTGAVYSGTTITLTALSDTVVAWDLGDGTTATGNPATVSYSNAGNYTVKLDAGMDERQCPVTSDNKVIEVTDIFIANAITPDGDGKNDELIITDVLDEASIKVINRWGQPVYERDPYDGGFTGAGLESGVYYYELRFRHFNNVFKGYVHIIK